MNYLTITTTHPVYPFIPHFSTIIWLIVSLFSLSIIPALNFTDFAPMTSSYEFNPSLATSLIPNRKSAFLSISIQNISLLRFNKTKTNRYKTNCPISRNQFFVQDSRLQVFHPHKLGGKSKRSIRKGGFRGGG